MKAQYINPFLVASVNLFRNYLGVQCSSGSPFINNDPQSLDEVTGIIGLAGETVGAVVLSFSRETAIGIASKMAGKTYTTMSNEVIDIVGELVNIVAGNAKRDLLEFRIIISLPGVLIGAGSRIKWPEGVPVITIPFESELGAFSVNVSLKV
jgi:Predicted inhibitor of MCP methylation, homolog of CheC